MFKYYLCDARTRAIIDAITEDAWECGTVDLEVESFAESNDILHRDFPSMEMYIYADDLQWIADQFCTVNIEEV